MSVEGTPACWKKGVKSEPEPRSPTWTSSGRAGRRRRGARRQRGDFSTGHRPLPPRGLGTERVSSRRNCLSEGTAEAEKSGPETADVHIEVGDGALQGFVVLLHPLRGADEAFFLGVPTAEDDGALGAPALAEQDADAVHRFQHGGGAAGGIDGAVDPGVAVIAGDDPIAGVLRAFYLSDHVPDDAPLIVLHWRPGEPSRLCPQPLRGDSGRAARPASPLGTPGPLRACRMGAAS